VTVGSHVDVWRRYTSDLLELASLVGLDSRSRNVLSSAVPIISQPKYPSDFRNRVNYGLEDAWARPRWATHLRDVASPIALETLLLSTGAAVDEHRVEIAMLTAISLGSNLYSDYLANANRPDKRRAEAREELLTTSLAGPVGDGLRGIFQTA